MHLEKGYLLQTTMNVLAPTNCVNSYERRGRISTLPVELLIIEAKSSGSNPKEIPNSIPSAIAT